MLTPVATIEREMGNSIYILTHLSYIPGATVIAVQGINTEPCILLSLLFFVFFAKLLKHLTNIYTSKTSATE